MLPEDEVGVMGRMVSWCDGILGVMVGWDLGLYRLKITVLFYNSFTLTQGKSYDKKNQNLSGRFSCAIAGYSKSCINTLKNADLLINKTEQSDPYENALTERMAGILKAEFNLDATFDNSEQVRETLKESIQIYNEKTSFVL